MTNPTRRNQDDNRPAPSSLGDIQFTVSGSVNGLVGFGNEVIQVGKTVSNGKVSAGVAENSATLIAGCDLPDLQPSDLTKLRRSISALFNEGELRDLCFDLGLDYDDLPGAAKKDKARELVAHYHRRARVGELVQACLRLRPGESKATMRGPPE